VFIVLGRLTPLVLFWLLAALCVTSMAAAVVLPSAGAHERALSSHKPAAVLAALQAAHEGTTMTLLAKRTHRRTHRARPALPSVSLVNQEWICDSPVNLASVTVRMTPAYPGGRRGGDAIHLENGCTGRIGKLTVVTSIADAVKVADGAHDLTIGGGSIRCLAKLPVLHQDGIQVMGGERITLRNLRVDCGRPSASLVNSNLFIRQSRRSLSPPTDVVCVGCHLGPDAAHTVTIRRSIRSGVESSTICTAKYPRLTLHVGPDAIDPVTARDSIGRC
jgi:hypothetical protein